MANVEWLIKKYMAACQMKSFSELSRQTGIKDRTLRDHLKQSTKLTVCEVQTLQDVLHMDNDGLLELITK